MSDYFEQRQLKTLKRLQNMRNTARANHDHAREKNHSSGELWWASQVNAIEQSISLVIDPDQLTIWSNEYENSQTSQ